MNLTIAQIVGLIDALEAGDGRIFFVERTGEVGISFRIQIKAGAVLKSTCGYGATADDAAADLWDQLTSIEPKEYLVVNAGREDRKAVRWNGVAWKTAYEPDRVPA